MQQVDICGVYANWVWRYTAIEALAIEVGGVAAAD